MECFNCGKKAYENHHVIPKSKGGIKTVPLCLECHGKVHDIKRSHVGHLSALKLREKQKEEYAWLFVEIYMNERTVGNLALEAVCYKISKCLLKNFKSRVRDMQRDDLYELINPILQLEKNRIYTKEWFYELKL